MSSQRKPRTAARQAPSRRSAQQSSSPPAGERLQKVLAAAGIGSRRQCEELIVEGRVEVDRRTVTELGTRVDPESQEIRVDGEPLRQRKRSYVIVNKPVGVLSTNSDPAGRQRVIDLIDTEERLFSVGRLDRTSEGLMLVTNDGDLAYRLTHPRFGVPKTYLVVVAGSPEPQQLQQLKQGVHLAEGWARIASFKVRRRRKTATELEIVLNEGRNREIRRLLARIGHKVLQLRRIAIGPLRLGQLPPGASRRLTPDEVRRLRDSISRAAGASGAASVGSQTSAAAPRPSSAGVAGAKSGAGVKGGKRPVRPDQGRAGG
ncbi:MAG: rRNA pseudouridine synthase, partial [Pirellulaceae bacterium]|nr:rRNA pseudouridine synthase [Pirellulaceae bacterium]